MKELNQKLKSNFSKLLLVSIFVLGFLASWVISKNTVGLNEADAGQQSQIIEPVDKKIDPILQANKNSANIFVNLAKKIIPSVVNISTVTEVKSFRGRRGGQEELFRRFFEDFFRQQMPGGPDQDENDSNSGRGPSRKGLTPKSFALGTGFVISVTSEDSETSNALILTNNHVVAEADEIKIHFTEDDFEKPADGEVVGRDPDLDLALIKVKTARKLTPVVLGDSDALEVGEYVMAVGNPFGQGHSVSHGIISAKERKAPDFILSNYLQTDTPINPGNSGGPLVNLVGEVIGINNAIDQRAQGIGFAIPINIVKQVLPQLKTKGVVSRGYIGVGITELTPELAEKIGLDKELTAPMVTQVYSGEPADEAGIKPYDVIIEVNGKKIRSASELVFQITQVNVGDVAKLKVLRGKNTKTFNVKVMTRPSKQLVSQKENTPLPKNQKSPLQLGMEVSNIQAEDLKDRGNSKLSKGVIVRSIDYNGPADRAGLLREDIIVEVDQKPISNVEQFFKIVSEKKQYMLRVQRLNPEGKEFYTVVVLKLDE